jgi:site-specific DNA recombinase
MKNENKELLLEQFGKRYEKLVWGNGVNAVIYTRVSTKEQAETNLSLETQKKYCEQFTNKQNYSVIAYFGGTYESAKTDERNEFKRMLAFVKRSREKISFIIVYSVDRFSRSGANAIFIASELKKEGISIIAVTQPADTTTSSGSLQQNIQFIFSQYDNDLRREKCMTGMREKLLKGYWLTIAPVGYDKVKINGEPKVIINKKGELLRKAFYWKAENGLSNQEILIRLKSLDFKLPKQQLSKILRNPFYCGMIAHNFLDGQVIEGRHEGLVSKDIFLKANGVLQKNHQNYKHDKEVEALPLKRFIKCGECGTSFTGYIVKKKGLYYYKCNRKGCKCNRNAKELHDLFGKFLGYFAIAPELIEPLKEQLTYTFEEMNKENAELQKRLESQLKDIAGRIETIEERFILREITKDLYDKFIGKYKDEKREVLEQLQKVDFGLSNLNKYISFAVNLSCNLQEMWQLSDLATKEKLQNLVFPEGIYYDRENGTYRTERTNAVFELIHSLSNRNIETERGQINPEIDLSPSVPRKRLELSCRCQRHPLKMVRLPISPPGPIKPQS